MGRPINKRNFGIPTEDKKALVLSSVFLEDSVEAEEGFYIVKQTGTRRYVVSNGARTGVVSLVGQEPSVAGEATIMVTPFGSGTPEYARTILSHLVKTYEDNVYKWSLNAATQAGEADLPTSLELTPEEEAIVEINEATSGAEVVALINETPSLFMDLEVYDAFSGMLVGRKEAVGSGVLEWQTIFGTFQSLNAIKDVVLLHTVTELNKAAVITHVDNASDIVELKAAFRDYLEAVVSDRQNMIADLRASGVGAAITRADELDADQFTIVLGQVQTLIDNNGDTDDFYQYILDERNPLPNSKFYGFTRMLPVLVDALALV